MKLSVTRGAPHLSGRRGSAAILISLFAAACSPATAHFNLFPDGDLQTVNKKLRQPVQALDLIDHINFNSDVLGDAEACPDLFVAGTPYGEGELVKIEGTTTSYIHLLEFQVMSGGTNIALNRAASQSTTLSSFAASRGVAGSNTTFSHTNQGPAQWFEVDLGTAVAANNVEGCPSDTGLPCKQPTKATTTTLLAESPLKTSTLSPTVAGCYVDPFNKVDIQSTSDTDPNRSEVLVFSRGRRNSVPIYLKLIFWLSLIMIVLDYLMLREYSKEITESPKLFNANDKNQEELNSCDTPNQCPIRKEVCLTNQLIDLYHVYTGVVYTIPESNMNMSNLKAFVTARRRPGPEFRVSSSHRITKSNHSIQLVEGILQRTIKASRDQIKGMQNDSNGIVLFPAYGKNSMFGEKTVHWPDYTTAFLVGEEVCFWPVVAPNLANNETDASFLMRDNRTKNAVQKQKVLVSGGFFNNFWHALSIFNQWCQFRHQQDVSLLVQTDGPSIKPFVYDVASALEIDKSRIIHHDRPIIAETIFTANFHDMNADWSCLHGALKKDSDQTIAVVYQRLGGNPRRDISPDIHSELVNELSVALGIPVKTFNGTGSLDEARELFSSAKIVIGPHGAGLANLIFVSSHWVPVIEYITPDLLDRPWQLYGGGSFGLPWFPVLLSSFESRDEIMKSVHVAKEALIIAEERLGEVLDLPSQRIDQAQQYHDTKPQRKYIVVDLRLGLTNQAAAAWCAVLVAEKLNRTLVLPQVRAKIPKGEIVAEENGILEDFDYIWDSEHFIHCAREKLNKPGLIFATDRQHYDVEIHQNDTFKLSPEQVPLLLDWNPALPIKYDFLGRFVGDNTSYVKVIQPISLGIAEKWNYLDCFVPSERLNKMIAAYKSKLPKEYVCLHARTESDWYSRACCGRQGNTTSESIDEWNCPIHPVSETCYKTPQQIADMLKSKLDSNMTLWISSGSSREALQPLFDSWNVVTKDDLSSDLYMDYGLAEVDRMMCRDAKTFWGMGGSSFSEEIKKFFIRNGRKADMYARKDWSIP